jgi:membrane protein DedA with SNARE-associated domain
LASGAGYLGIFFLMLLESAAFPVPSEIILPLAGYFVFQGTLQYWPVVFYSTVAALLGSFIDYYVRRKLGSSMMTGQAKLAYVQAAPLRRVQAWFNKYGPAAVAILRMVPTARANFVSCWSMPHEPDQIRVLHAPRMSALEHYFDLPGMVVRRFVGKRGFVLQIH